jgi:hypothetical protein
VGALGQEPDIGRLRDAAARLAAELDEARLFQAAAYAAMAVDSVERSAGEEAHAEAMRTDVLRQAQDDPSTGSGRAGRSHSQRDPEALRGDVDLDFELDEHGRVWMIREGDCHIIGRSDAVCAEMRRFLAGVVLGHDRFGPVG